MLQTPGSLKNRDVSLTAFPPRGLGAFGEIIDESPGMQRENEHHTQRLTARQSLAHSVCVRQCVCVKTTDWKRERVCVYVYTCVYVRGCVRVHLRVCLSEEEENRVIIPFFV